LRSWAEEAQKEEEVHKPQGEEAQKQKEDEVLDHKPQGEEGLALRQKKNVCKPQGEGLALPRQKKKVCKPQGEDLVLRLFLTSIRAKGEEDKV
jgi:hypothetical protein